MADTPKDSKVPDWKIRIMALKERDQNTAKVYQDQFKYSDTEKGLRNEKTDSFIKIGDNGNVDLFAGDTTGITLNDRYDTVNIMGHGLNVNTQYTNINTHPLGLRWNGYALNPQLYNLLQEDLLLDASIRYWVSATDKVPAHWERRSITLKPFIQISNEDKLGSLLKQLGIPT